VARHVGGIEGLAVGRSQGSPGLVPAPLATVAASNASRFAADRATGIGPGAAVRHVEGRGTSAGIEDVAAPAQARQPARRAPVPPTVKLAVLATAFSRDGCRRPPPISPAGSTPRWWPLDRGGSCGIRGND